MFMKQGVFRPNNLAVTVGGVLIVMLLMIPGSASAQIDSDHFSLHGYLRGSAYP